METTSCLRVWRALILAVLVTASLSPPVVAQEQKLLASDGHSVSVSGDYAIVGDWRNSEENFESGAAYILKREEGGWVEQQKLLASDARAGDNFGFSVSMSGDLALVGARSGDGNRSNTGSVYVFRRMEGEWVEEQELLASDGQANDYFGASVSVWGNHAIVGAWGDDDKGDNTGSAYVFRRAEGEWIEQQKLTAGDAAADDRFGYSVSISDNHAIVGAHYNDDKGTSTGSAYVFRRAEGKWIEQQKLLTVYGRSFDFLGYSVAISGNYAIVGAPKEDDKGENSGAAYIFKHVGGVWVERQKLLARDGMTGDNFGWSVSMAGDLAVVGAWLADDQVPESGSAYVFERVEDEWGLRLKLTASDQQSGDYFGWSVSITDNHVLVGAYGDDDKGYNAGSAYVYPLPPFFIVLRRNKRTATGLKKAIVGWNFADVDNAMVDFYVDEVPDGSPLKRAPNTGTVELKLPTVQFPGDGPFRIQACAAYATDVCSNVLNVGFRDNPAYLVEGADGSDDEVVAGEETPATFTLEGNHPNPFNPATTIRYRLAEAGPVQLRVYDVLGREVAVVVDSWQAAGMHAAAFEAGVLPSGTYLYRLTAAGQVKTGRMLLLK